MKTPSVIIQKKTFVTILSTDISDVDILGNYVYVTFPLLHQVVVYEFNVTSKFRELYSIKPSTVETWPGFQGDNRDRWFPVAVHAHLALPNLIYVEQLDCIVIISVNFNDPVYVNVVDLESKYTDSNWDRAVLVTPTNLLIVEAHIDDSTQ